MERTISDQAIGEIDPAAKKLGVGKAAKTSTVAAARKPNGKEPKGKLCILRPNAKIIQTSTLEAAATGDVEELERLYSIDTTSVNSKVPQSISVREID